MYLYLLLEIKKTFIIIIIYIERNINCRKFVAARELQENDEKFMSFYRKRKKTYMLLPRPMAPVHRSAIRTKPATTAASGTEPESDSVARPGVAIGG